MDNLKIGQFIASLRKDKGLTQKELGEKLSVTDKAISKWERGLSFPDITLLTTLSEILDVSVPEILNGEYGETPNINVQEEVDKVIQSLNKKRNKSIITIFILSLIIVFAFITIFLFLQKDKSDYINNVEKIVEGENFYKLENYNLEQNGFDKIIEIISHSEYMLPKYNVAFFEAQLNSQGDIINFKMSLYVFDDMEKYVGMASFQYKNNTLTYNRPKDDHLNLVHTYSKNSDINYLNEQIKKIPLNKQIKLSELKFYFVTYQSDTNIEANTPIFDARNNKKITPLSKSDYNNGLGGKSDGNTRTVVRLYDGSSIAVGQQYLFVFDELEDSAPNNFGYLMETDYYINQGNLKFTRDYGKTWIDTDITKDELDETLSFYRDISLKCNSWFLSTNESFPIAYFYR